MRRHLFVAAAAVAVMASPLDAATIEKSTFASGAQAAGGPYQLTSIVGDIIAGRAQAVSKDLWHGFLAPLPEQLVGVDGPDVTFGDFLRPPSPNPSRLRTMFHFGLATRANVDLSVHDLAGRRIHALYHGELPAGVYHHAWDLRSTTGEIVPSGVYFARLTVAGRVRSHTLVIQR